MPRELPIQPQIVGLLTYTDPFGNKGLTPTKIYFATGCDGESKKGEGYAVFFSETCGTCLCSLARANGETFCIPGYEGLTCRYDEKTGTIIDFQED